MSANDPLDTAQLPTVTPLGDRDETATRPSRHLEMLSRARDSGKNLLWMGLAGAFAWWVAAFGGTLALAGPEELSRYSPAVIIAGFVALAIPGLMLVMAGFLARENSRAAASNAVVLEAAARLLAPMQTTGEESTVFAGHMRDSAAQVDRSMAHALSSMKAMAAEISDERQRLESVSHVTADNAKELAERLHKERSALEHLAADIRQQTELMSEAIPRQAEQMRESARAAASDIAEADEALEVRLETLDGASTRLSEKIAALDEMSAEAARRNEELSFAVSRMEEKLDQSSRTVDRALRAGEMAAASAHTTGDRLTEAVNAALEQARTASRDIQAEALQASEQAATSLAQLKAAGEEAAAAVRAARAEAEAEAERRKAEAAAEAERVAATSPSPAPTPEQEAPHAPARGPSQPKLEDDDVFEDDPAAAPVETDDLQDDKTDPDLFGAAETEDKAEEATQAETVSAAPTPAEPEPKPEPEPKTSAHNGDGAKPATPPKTAPFFRRRADRHPTYLKPVGGTSMADAPASEATIAKTPSDDAGAAGAPLETATTGTHTTTAPSQQWSDILADMEQDDNQPLPREDVAEAVIEKLMEAGVRLGEIFRPRDKKKIASAARKGAGLRRRAVIDTAARQVQRVQRRLDGDPKMMHMAREFLAMEEPDALTALEKTARSSRNASARLAAFMLIDAALS